MARTKKPRVVKDAHLGTIHGDTSSHPCLIFSGDAPSEGDTIHTTLSNGVLFGGVVSAVFVTDDLVTAEFHDGLRAV